MRHYVLLGLLSTSLMASGCVPLLLGGAATAGYIASQDRGTETAISDIKIKTYIKDKLTQQHYQYLTQVEITVLRGNVLITGVVSSSKQALEVEAVVQSVQGVQQVYNELFTDGYYPAKQYTQDTWLATEIKSLMFAEKDIKSVNYNIHVVNGHAYVFGYARTASELEAVKYLLRTTKGVKQVHSFIRVI
ncbi:MAG: hypothetical protein CMF60_05925 [Magnetococcales bacterium]|nr:hypothetical protein [Magnetococcales bacterium]MEC8067764.1 BON domain-containing protein [Pseudomonadota bacterium]|tara:strand:- start:33526 stop:34095 length:570 start_codon:yes stop_codon:yes gene_type:complete